MSPQPPKSPSVPKQPPHSLEAEQNVLGGLMHANEKLLGLNLRADHFYRADHQLIFQTIHDMVSELGVPCDFVTLSEHLRNQGKLEYAGGIAYLGSLAADVYSVTNIQHYADIVRERALLRGIIAAAADVADSGYRPDGKSAHEVLAEAMVKFDRLQRSRVAPARSMADVMDKTEALLGEIAHKRANKQSLGPKTGVPCIDRRTGGLLPPRFWLLAGRPSLGKSALVWQWALHAAQQGFPGYVASLEMGEEELGFRARANWGKVNVTSLSFANDEARNGSAEAAADLGRLPLWVDTDTFGLAELQAQLVAMRWQHQIKFAIVDHIQLVEVPGARSRVDELSLIGRTLKKLTKTLNIPIVALSQLGRAVEKDRRRPQLADLRDSGTLEQDADIVCFIHSDDEDKLADKSIAVGFGKNRGGRKGWCEEKVIFRGATQRFEEQEGSDA